MFNLYPHNGNEEDDRIHICIQSDRTLVGLLSALSIRMMNNLPILMGKIILFACEARSGGIHYSSLFIYGNIFLQFPIYEIFIVECERRFFLPIWYV